MIDANGRFVTVADRDTYQLGEGERFVETVPPQMRPAAGYPGFVKPVWNGEKWTEGATFPEIMQWEITHMKTGEGKTIWATLEDAYKEGVNSV